MNQRSMLLAAMLLLISPLSQAADEAPEKKAEAPAAQAYTAKTPKLNRAQIDAWLAKPTEVLFIDVRRPDEISKIGTFPVYLNIQNNALENALPFIPKDRSIVTVSNHAGRAGKAADFLAEKGFKVVGAVGTQNYEEEGGVITRIAIPEPKAPAAGAAPAPAADAAKADEHAAHHAKKK
jgi:rhodanese-related sulfurtransferase